MTILWWHWLVLGLTLIALEIAAAGGFYIIFFGVAALLIAGLHLTGVAGPLWFQLLLFSVFSVGSLLVFRGPLMRRLEPGPGQADMDTLVGDIGVALEEIAPGAIGRIELRGTTWTTRNAGLQPIPKGSRCTVLRRDRLTLFVQIEEAA
jgi:hypothetical protein